MNNKIRQISKQRRSKQRRSKQRRSKQRRSKQRRSKQRRSKQRRDTYDKNSIGGGKKGKKGKKQKRIDINTNDEDFLKDLNNLIHQHDLKRSPYQKSSMQIPTILSEIKKNLSRGNKSDAMRFSILLLGMISAPSTYEPVSIMEPIGIGSHDLPQHEMWEEEYSGNDYLSSIPNTYATREYLETFTTRQLLKICLESNMIDQYTCKDSKKKVVKNLILNKITEEKIEKIKEDNPHVFN